MESPKKASNEALGFIPERDIRKFSVEDCNDYLVNSHSEKELKRMKLKDKIELILELEFNFQNNSF